MGRIRLREEREHRFQASLHGVEMADPDRPATQLQSHRLGFIQRMKQRRGHA